MSESPAHVGDIAIVLHSHMPYVEGFGTYPFGEEWLFDAVIRAYLPLLEVAEGVSMTVTPVLADQLESDGVRERITEFARTFRLGSAEADAGEMETPELRAASAAEAERYRLAVERLEECEGDVLESFAESGRRGRVELVASAATHAILPLVATRAGRRLQLTAGLRSHRRRFGSAAGFWLPECAYAPGLETLLADEGIRYFCVDQSDFEQAAEALRPIAAGATTALPLDWEAVQWLWSLDGYPSWEGYSDFHHETYRGGHPWTIGGGAYDPEAASRRAREQAAEFADAVAGRLSDHRSRHGAPGLLTFAIDTELLGHWWWEGPIWLEAVLQRLPERGVRPLKLGEAVEAHPGTERELRRSSWGESKDLRTWDSPAVADLAWGARRLELRLLREIAAGRLADRPRLERAARELLAVQASDWAFLDYRRQAGDYPFQRVLGHSRELFEAIESPQGPEPRLRSLAPDLSVAPLLEP